jgi:hypothetical protein
MSVVAQISKARVYMASDGANRNSAPVAAFAA